MNRRDLLTSLGGIAALPASTRAQQSTQQPALPLIGFLSGASAAPFTHLVAAFRQGLGDTGFVEGQNVAIEYRWAENRYERLPEMAKELVRRRVTVLVASGGDRAALAAQAASASIPIIFSAGGDPVANGLVASLGRPGANLTGVSLLTTLLEAKRLSLLREALPAATRIGLLVNPGGAVVQSMVQESEQAARSLGVRLVVVKAEAESEFEPAFASLLQQRADALVVINSAFFNSRREQLVALSARHKLPTIYEFGEFARAGGLMSYGTHLGEMYRQIGVYTGRILKGAKPADLPVLQPTRFELVINLLTAKALGLAIPKTLLLRADELIE